MNTKQISKINKYEIKEPIWKDKSIGIADFRLKKIIKLLNSGIFFKEYNPPSLIIVKDKFIISLIKNIWRIKGKQVWYRHTENLNSFKENYIEKDFKKI